MTSFTVAIDHRAQAGAALELEVGMERAGWLQQRRGRACQPFGNRLMNVAEA